MKYFFILYCQFKIFYRFSKVYKSCKYLMTKTTERTDILRSLEKSKLLNSKESYEEAYNELTKGIQRVLKSNFLPLLDVFFNEHILSSVNLKKNFDVCTDYLVRLAPEIRTINPNQVMQNFLDFLGSSAQMKFMFPKHFRPLFPLKFSIRYDKPLIVAGNKVNILTTLISHAAVTFHIDNLSYALLHDSDEEKEDVISIADNLEVQPRKPIKFTTERSLPAAISTERIRGVIIKMKTLELQIPMKIPTLMISPDTSACNINIKMPPRCIIGAHLPVQIELTAAEQKIERLNVHFKTEDQSFPIEIKGHMNDIEISDQITQLPDIEPYKSITLDMTVFSSTPSFNTVIFTVNFGTALSGTGEFSRPLQFHFLSPFSSDIKIFDDNFVEIPAGIQPVLESGANLTAEVTLMNQIQSPVNLTKISSDSDKLAINTVELPVLLNPYETFSFFTILKQPGTHEFSLSYQTEGIESNTFSIQLPAVLEQSRHVLISVKSPHSVPLNEEFTATIIIERINQNEGPEVVPLKLEIGTSPGFYICGPIRKHFEYIFKGQKKEIPINFFPLKAGSMTLPQFQFIDMSIRNSRPKVFIIPIVVTYQ